MKIQTESIQFKADAKLVSRIENKLNKLDRLFDRIIEAHVKLKLENSGKVKDKIMEVHLKVPNQTLTSGATEKTFESALDQVEDSLKRQLIKYKERLRNHS